MSFAGRGSVAPLPAKLDGGAGGHVPLLGVWGQGPQILSGFWAFDHAYGRGAGGREERPDGAGQGVALSGRGPVA